MLICWTCCPLSVTTQTEELAFLEISNNIRDLNHMYYCVRHQNAKRNLKGMNKIEITSRPLSLLLLTQMHGWAGQAVRGRAGSTTTCAKQFFHLTCT